MKRIHLYLIACLIILSVVLSSCAGGQNESSVQSSEPGTKMVASSQNDTEPPQDNTPNASTESISPEPESSAASSDPAASEETEENMQNIKITVNGETFSATLAETSAARAFAEMLPLTLNLSDYSGFEKVGPLGTNLPTDNQQITTQSGDIVLYNGNQIVIFYGSNSWSYTRLGRIDDLSGWEEALGSGDVTVVFSVED